MPVYGGECSAPTALRRRTATWAQWGNNGGGTAATALSVPSPQVAPTAMQDAPTTAPIIDPPTEAPAAVDPPTPTVPPTDAPPATAVPSPAPAATAVGLYKDGQYTGPEVDAYY